jgi:hypothetical protein
MNKFLSFGNSVSNPVVINETADDAADDPADDPADDVDIVVDDRVNQNSIILQNQSSVPNITNFLGDVYTSGILKSAGLEITGNIIVNGKILSTSSSSSNSTGSDSTSLNELQTQINELQTQINEFISNDEVSELRELVNDLTFKNQTNTEINNLKLNLLTLESKFDNLTNS